MASRNSKEAREERERKLVLQHKFENRITTTRFGKESFDVKDYSKAIGKYKEYMEIMAESKKAPDIYSIKVSDFDPKKDVTEMLMISHLYFEMARIYDAVPKFQDDAKKCLSQFVHFSANQPYQVVNSELIRKYIKKSIFKNPVMFQEAYQQIYVQSKKCYVVTFCYGPQHDVTQDYRKLKDWMLDYKLGQELVRLYYCYSSKAVLRWQRNPFMHLMGRFFIRPVLHLFSKTLLRLILPKC